MRTEYMKVLPLIAAVLALLMSRSDAYTLDFVMDNGLTPFLECTTNHGDNLCTSYFGYWNTGTSSVIALVGGPKANVLFPGNVFQGQPTVFRPGRIGYNFSVDHDCDSNLTWMLNDASVTAGNSTTCLEACCYQDIICGMKPVGECPGSGLGIGSCCGPSGMCQHANPSPVPSARPSTSPTAFPSYAPSAKPTSNPTATVTVPPTSNPTAVPTAAAYNPTAKPTNPKPTAKPTIVPSSVLFTNVLECNINYGNGTCTTWFGYYNGMSSSVTVPIGSSNIFTPTSDMGQPTVFLPGRVKNAFSVTHACATTIKWTLNGYVQTSSTATTCTEACCYGTQCTSQLMLTCAPYGIGMGAGTCCCDNWCTTAH